MNWLNKSQARSRHQCAVVGQSTTLSLFKATNPKLGEETLQRHPKPAHSAKQRLFLCVSATCMCLLTPGKCFPATPELFPPFAVFWDFSAAYLMYLTVSCLSVL